MANGDGGGLSTPQWALVIAGAIIGIGLILDAAFDVIDRTRPRICHHFELWCPQGGENECEDDPFDDCGSGNSGGN